MLLQVLGRTVEGELSFSYAGWFALEPPCFEAAASLCLGFPGFLLSCVLCRDVGMKPAFVLPKPACVALLPGGSRGSAVQGAAVLGVLLPG